MKLSRFERITIIAQLAYLARVALLILLFMAVFMPLALFSGVSVLLASLYDLDNFWKNFWFSLFAFLLAFTVTTNLKMALLYGGERAGFDRETNCWLRQKMSRWFSFDYDGKAAARFYRRYNRNIIVRFAPNPTIFVTAVSVTAILVLGVVVFAWHSPLSELAWRFTGLVLGFLASLFVLLAASIFHRLIYERETAEKLPNFLYPYTLYPFSLVTPFRDWANRTTLVSGYSQRIKERSIPRSVLRRLRKIPHSFGRGYFEYDRRRGRPMRTKTGGVVLLPGHTLATSMFVFFLIIYLIVGYFVPPGVGMTAISYVMLLLTVVCWMIAGMTFFLDRYRFPVLVSIILLMIAASMTSDADIYTVRDLTLVDQRGIQQKLTPREVLYRGKRPAKDAAQIDSAPKRNYVILVAADGGGIQAAVWTTQVLTGIEEHCRQIFPNESHERCGGAIRLISSVSGGSVGAMHFVNAYDKEDGLPANLAQIRENAMESSLDPVAWGMAYPDLARTFVPFYSSLRFHPFNSGRGQALEAKWIEQECKTGRCTLDQNLSEWRVGVKEGWRPSVIFNATIAETGERLLIGTSDICATTRECAERTKQQPKVPGQTPAAPQEIEDKRRVGRWNFYDFMSEKDISIATAARLSASFPYITPAARASSDGSPGQRMHIVDGGYYDNYGMSSLIEWLNEALENDEKLCKNPKLEDVSSCQNRITDVLVVQIRGNTAADTNSLANVESGKGWYYQLAAPLLAMTNVRTTGQLSHNEAEFNLFQNYWRGKINIETAIFQYENGNKEPSPLSWHLTDRQKQNVRDAWQKIVKEDDAEKGLQKFSDFVQKPSLP